MLLKIIVHLGIILTCHLAKGHSQRSGVGPRSNIRGLDDINPNVKFHDVNLGANQPAGADDGGSFSSVSGWDSNDNGVHPIGADDGGSQSGRRGNILGWDDVDKNVKFEDISSGSALGSDDSGDPSLGWGSNSGGGTQALGTDTGGSGRRTSTLGWNDIDKNVRFEDISTGEVLGPDGRNNIGASWNSNTGNNSPLGTDTGRGVNRGNVLGKEDVIDKVDFNLNGAEEGLVGPQPNPLGMDTDGLGYDVDCETINRKCDCYGSGSGGTGSGGGNPFPKPQLQMDDYPESTEESLNADDVMSISYPMVLE